jgi:hypothetical protein
MSFPSIRALAAAVLALSAAGGAQAYNNGFTGSYSATIHYQHFIQISEDPAQWGSTSHQSAPTANTYQGCLDQLNYTLDWLTGPAQNTTESYYHVATVVPCHFIPPWGGVGVVNQGISLDLLMDFSVGERALRQRYRLDQYEAELDALYKRLQPPR